MFPREKPELDPMFANHKWKFLEENVRQLKIKNKKKIEIPADDRIEHSSIKEEVSALCAHVAPGKIRSSVFQRRAAAAVCGSGGCCWADCLCRGRRLHYSLPQQAAHAASTGNLRAECNSGPVYSLTRCRRGGDILAIIIRCVMSCCSDPWTIFRCFDFN